MKRRIAVVDDDAENRRAVSELLAVEGFDPLAFESGDARPAECGPGVMSRRRSAMR